MNANELRIGNWIRFISTDSYEWVENIKSNSINNVILTDIEPIPLTPEILEKCGFKQLPHYTVQNNWNISLGRDRVISVANVETPNEMVFINEEQPPEVKNIIVARNYDYDGYTHLHQLQNLYYALTQTELPITL